MNLSRALKCSVVPTLVFVVTTAVALSCDDPQERACAEMGVAHIEKEKAEGVRDYSNFETETFYSPVTDSCVHVTVAIIGVEFEVRDISHTLLDLHGGILLHCDEYGADSIILDAVSQRFTLRDVPYEEWLDDGFGGPPRAIKSPDMPYTRSDCQRVLDKWLSFVARVRLLPN